MTYTHLLEGKTPCRLLDTRPGGLVQVLTAAHECLTVPGVLITPLFVVDTSQDNTGAAAGSPGGPEPQGMTAVILTAGEGGA